MKLLECVKIFDMNPPSFKISNTKKEVEDMLIGTPVVLHKVGSVEDDFELDNVIGYVDMIVPSTSKDEIYGNVFIFKDNVSAAVFHGSVKDWVIIDTLISNGCIGCSEFHIGDTIGDSAKRQSLIDI